MLLGSHSLYGEVRKVTDMLPFSYIHINTFYCPGYDMTDEKDILAPQMLMMYVCMPFSQTYCDRVLDSAQLSSSALRPNHLTSPIL
jgi:hypothetical protein